jgi:D-sedoheptulose 7-phosphate isomerase
VVKALKYAREVGARTVAFTGFEGGLVKAVADVSIIAPSDHMGRIEDAHMIVSHLAAFYMMERMTELA